MARTIENITISDVARVVKEALGLKKDVELNANTLLKDLEAEPIDVLDIYFKLGIELKDYVSGESVRDKGRERMLDIADANLYCYAYGKNSDVIHFIKLSMSKTSNECQLPPVKDGWREAWFNKQIRINPFVL